MNIFMKSNSSYFSFVACALGVIFKVALLIPDYKNLPVFYSKVLALKFRLLIHFELIFMYDVRGVAYVSVYPVV